MVEPTGGILLRRVLDDPDQVLGLDEARLRVDGKLPGMCPLVLRLDLQRIEHRLMLGCRSLVGVEGDLLLGPLTVEVSEFLPFGTETSLDSRTSLLIGC